ncbi:DEAD/DEAH box helicase [Acidithiobacillus ferrooxidans]|uniref:DEAD/DEAH box helicase family protein n=1 Tax=Acidithiobacillus ferrooxidans TaxID=920 RepID=UPI001C065F94|nr:DEAD/DEAH box helicase family protein [Acidithiobacillus ferrooxidans]MBU2859141.1 DEAD/DEAH box helicase [Acidithiobacillus ferrooxidans]
MTQEEYYEKYGSKIAQESERLFVDEFLYPLLGSNIESITPQYPFLDRTGKTRRIDFAYHGTKAAIALEVNGESYHAEGIIPNELFDDNLFRQNEILRSGYVLMRFSYSQLQSPQWRPIILETLRDTFRLHAPELLTEYSLTPTRLQEEVLQALNFYRNERGWQKGIVVLPTGTGKTILSALDSMKPDERVLFMVHRLDILAQSIEAYKFVNPTIRVGILTGEERRDEQNCDVLFASKDTLRQPSELSRFPRDWFDYIVVDEVHHGQSPTYREILTYFTPGFMLGMTATPDRTDRKDIFELFDYNKVYEIPLTEAIERGFLVPYSYYGLTDNVDYSKIRHNGKKYRTDDLERLLIIPERNAAVLREYLDKGGGDKAIGFCISIKHAERMAEYFTQFGVTAAAIHSKSPTRDDDLKAFRENKTQVAFTVDLFNEGMDFPNIRILLFLRPTESKTVFIQQLGRGLRLCAGKDRVRVLDFIGNYKRANQIKKYLSKGTKASDVEGGGRKIEYEYSTGCEVIFSAEVEEIINRQDAQELGVSKEELEDSYFAFAETLGRKPSQADLNESKYKAAVYIRIFGSWLKFLREIGEYTEASYHYPQGTHLGHILSLLKVFGSGNRDGTHFDDEYIRLRGGLGENRLGTYQRQIKYKLQAAMELGILPDDRTFADGTDYPLELTTLGRELYNAFRPMLDRLDLDFPRETDGVPSTRMHDNEESYNNAIRDHIRANTGAREVAYRVFLKMHAVRQMLAYLYHIIRAAEVERGTIYDQFFQAPFVRQFCDQEGIDEATPEASRRRCPFLLNILSACDVVDTERSKITVRKLLLLQSLVKPYQREEAEITAARLRAIAAALPASPEKLDDENLSIARELFGGTFLTAGYHLNEFEIVED